MQKNPACPMGCRLYSNQKQFLLKITRFFNSVKKIPWDLPKKLVKSIIEFFFSKPLKLFCRVILNQTKNARVLIRISVIRVLFFQLYK